MRGCLAGFVQEGITFLNQHDSYAVKITYDKIKMAFYCMKSGFNRILHITNVKN